MQLGPLFLAGFLQLVSSVAQPTSPLPPLFHSSTLVPVSGSSLTSAVLDLSPFFARAKEVAHSVHTPPSFTTRTYSMGTLDGVGHDGTLPDFEQCSPSSLICLSALNTRPSHRAEQPRIISVAVVAASLEGATSRLIVRDDKEFADIEVVLLGENYVNIKQRTIVTFTCDPQAPEPSDPTFTRSRDGDHYFSWITKLGCLDVAKTGIKEPSDGGQGEEQPPSHAPSPEQGETLKTVQRESRVVLWSSVGFNVLFFIALLIVLNRLRSFRGTRQSPLIARFPLLPFSPSASKSSLVRYSAVREGGDDCSRREGQEEVPLLRDGAASQGYGC